MTETKTCIRCGEERPLSSYERPNAPCRPPRKWCAECCQAVLAMRKSTAPSSDAELLAAMNAVGKDGRTAWERYWSYVDKRPGGCWLWIGAKSGKAGYGTFTVGGYAWRTNRLAYALKHGLRSIRRVMVCHSCDRPACVNPDHLWPGSHHANMKDMVRKARRRGERNSAAVLTEEIVLELRRSKLPHAVWAKRLGVHATTIHSARVGKKWSHLPGAWPRTERVQ